MNIQLKIQIKVHLKMLNYKNVKFKVNKMIAASKTLEVIHFFIIK